MKNAITQKPEKVIRKYTMEEFWENLYWEIGDEDGDYDALLHIVSPIDGTQLKIPIKQIFSAASKVQN